MRDWLELCELRDSRGKLIDVAYSEMGLRWATDKTGWPIAGYYECTKNGETSKIEVAYIKQAQNFGNYDSIQWEWGKGLIVDVYKYVNHSKEYPKLKDIINSKIIGETNDSTLYQIDHERRDRVITSYYSVGVKQEKLIKDLIIAEMQGAEKYKALAYYKDYNPNFRS